MANNKRRLSDEQVIGIEKLTREGEYLRPAIARAITEIYERTKVGSTCSIMTVWNWQKKLGLI